MRDMHLTKHTYLILLYSFHVPFPILDCRGAGVVSTCCPWLPYSMLGFWQVVSRGLCLISFIYYLTDMNTDIQA